MKKIRTIFITGLLMLAVSQPVMAGGALKRLKTIADNMDLQQKALEEETGNYRKAEELINGPEIKKGLSSGFILERCGEPAAKANGGIRWVYKPHSSTFFKGEKIYFIFDGNRQLIGWEKVEQK